MAVVCSVSLVACGGAVGEDGTQQDSSALSRPGLKVVQASGPAYGACPNGILLNVTNLDGPNSLDRGQWMNWGECFMNDSHYIFAFQLDGNIVIYNNVSRVLWTASIGGRGANRLIMQKDGNLVAYTPRNVAVWSTRTTTTGLNWTDFVFQNDGNAVVYQNGAAVWASHTSGK